MRPTIVISAFNRPKAFGRLLASVQKAQYPADFPVRLVISIDRAVDNSHREVLELANRFQWDHGVKQIILQEEHLGLVEHFYRCGNLSQEYESIILLEDDLFVSPVYYLYALQALDFFKGEPLIAGVSLYALWFNGYTHFPFIPLPDESDVFFLQIPYTQGQAFTGDQWASFRTWLEDSNRRVTAEDPLHEMFLKFSEDEWFPVRTQYLVETGRYFVYPRNSLTTGFCDAGAHFTKTSQYFQVPLQTAQREYRFIPLNHSNAVYDSYFEILPDRIKKLNPLFFHDHYEVDLNGTKSPTRLHEDLVLTSQPCRAPLHTYGKVMMPLEANIIYDVPGKGISLCKKEDIKTDWLSNLVVNKGHFDYFTRHHPVGKKLLVKFMFVDFVKKLGWRLD